MAKTGPSINVPGTRVRPTESPGTGHTLNLPCRRNPRAILTGRPYIRLPAVNAPDASIRFRLPDEWHPNGRTSVKINTLTGDITLSARSDEVSPARRLVNQLYPLHSAYGMNAVYVFLVFFSGITLVWLSLTGGISYFKKRATR